MLSFVLYHNSIQTFLLDRDMEILSHQILYLSKRNQESERKKERKIFRALKPCLVCIEFTFKLQLVHKLFTLSIIFHHVAQRISRPDKWWIVNVCEDSELIDLKVFSQGTETPSKWYVSIDFYVSDMFCLLFHTLYKKIWTFHWPSFWKFSPS